MVVMKVIKEKILKLHVSMKVKPYAFSWGVLNHITHKVLHVSTNWCSLVEPITIKCPCLWSQNFYKRAPLNWEFSTSGLHEPQYIYKQTLSTYIFSAFGRTNSQTRNIYKQWETSTTHTHAAMWETAPPAHFYRMLGQTHINGWSRVITSQNKGSTSYIFPFRLRVLQ